MLDGDSNKNTQAPAPTTHIHTDARKHPKQKVSAVIHYFHLNTYLLCRLEAVPVTQRKAQTSSRRRLMWCAKDKIL